MELHAKNLPVEILHCRDCRFRASRDFKPRRRIEDAIAVAHPNAAHAIEQAGGLHGIEFARTILAMRRWLYSAAQFLADELHPITNAENGNT